MAKTKDVLKQSIKSKVIAGAVERVHSGINPVSAFMEAATEVVRGAAREDKKRRSAAVQNSLIAAVMSPYAMVELGRVPIDVASAAASTYTLPISTQPETAEHEDSSVFNVEVKEIRGRFGNKPAKFRWMRLSPTIIRIDDDANPGTSINLNCDEHTASGVVFSEDSPVSSKPSRFVVAVSHKGKVFRVDDQDHLPFWLNVTLF